MRITYVRGGYYHYGRRGEKEIISLFFSSLKIGTVFSFLEGISVKGLIISVSLIVLTKLLIILVVHKYIFLIYVRYYFIFNETFVTSKLSLSLRCRLRLFILIIN